MVVVTNDMCVTKSHLLAGAIGIASTNIKNQEVINITFKCWFFHGTVKFNATFKHSANNFFYFSGGTRLTSATYNTKFNTELGNFHMLICAISNSHSLNS